MDCKCSQLASENGVVCGSFDINGRYANYSLLTGLGWGQTGSSGWASAEITYYVG